MLLDVIGQVPHTCGQLGNVLSLEVVAGRMVELTDGIAALCRVVHHVHLSVLLDGAERVDIVAENGGGDVVDPVCVNRFLAFELGPWYHCR